MKIDSKSKLFITLAVLGIPISIYHGYSELFEVFSYCNVNQVFSCGNVFASGITSVFGVPFWILGVIWFPLILVLGLIVIKREGTPGAYILAPVLMIGNVFTVYLWYLEVGVIRAYCPVCITLYVINYALTAIALWAG